MHTAVSGFHTRVSAKTRRGIRKGRLRSQSLGRVSSQNKGLAVQVDRGFSSSRQNIGIWLRNYNRFVALKI